MAHEWIPVTDKRARLRTCRECTVPGCGAFQVHECVGGDVLAGWEYSWQPLVGRCTNERRAAPKSAPVWLGQLSKADRARILDRIPAQVRGHILTLAADIGAARAVEILEREK